VPNPAEHALQVAEQIVVLRTQLAALEAQFALIVNGAGQPVVEQTPPNGTAQGSAASRILAVFTRQPGKRIATQTVVAELADIDASMVRSTVARFSRAGKLKRVGRGVYKTTSEVGAES
jgi:hypothetical protein